MSRSYLGIGSNLGDRLENLESAVRGLSVAGSVVVAVSSVYRTEPVGLKEQPEFLNAVVAVDTELTPRGLLALAQEVERAAGRDRSVRWGPRTLDVDILLYEDAEVDDPDLEIPHPRLAERRFALEPLVEIAPDATLPDGTTARGLLERLGAGGAVEREPGMVIAL